MILIDLSDLVIGTRQRTEFDQAALNQLADSIAGKGGLLHPPVVYHNEEDSKWHLVAGERRVRAMTALHASKREFKYAGNIVPTGKIPVSTLSDGTEEIVRFNAELEENIVRVDLSWGDKTRALAALHRMRQATNPTQTVLQTAKELHQKAPEQPTEQLRKEIRMSRVVEPHLANTKIANARNLNEAYQLVLQDEGASYQAELIRRKKKQATVSLSCSIRAGDSAQIMTQLDTGIYDLILTDPPYGIGAGAGGYRSRAVHHHNYEDTPEYAREILRLILVEGWRVCKPKANCFIFTDIKHFDWLQTYSAQMGWTPWRYPIIWQKSTSEGLVPWGRHGFAHTFDVIFWATKGQRGILRPRVDILTYPRVMRNERVYAAEKPVPLLKEIIDLSTLPSDWVLDPCAGSGSTIVAAKELQRNALGIEIDTKIADLATVRVEQGDSKADFSILNEAEESGEEEKKEEALL
jgi:site-specific DNA-methyltransferase (adenine-specific)